MIIDYLAEGEPLSDRERVVLELVAEGLSNRGIGAKLHLSHKTVEQHLYNAFAKLGVRSRVAAAVEAARRGMIWSGADDDPYATGYRRGFLAALDQVAKHVTVLSERVPP